MVVKDMAALLFRKLGPGASVALAVGIGLGTGAGAGIGAAIVWASGAQASPAPAAQPGQDPVTAEQIRALRSDIDGLRTDLRLVRELDRRVTVLEVQQAGRAVPARSTVP